MSTNTSSSGVRNLRAMFENKEDEASPSRSRSPAGSTTSENRRTSKVRASFVSVEPGHLQMDSEAPSSASARRESFSLSEPQDSDKIAELKTTVSQEKEQRKQSAVAETIPEFAIEATPAASPAIKPRTEKAMGDFVSKSGPSLKNAARASQDAPGMNPDKVISAVEETPATMKPTDPKDESVVSGGEALPPPAESISKPLAGASKASPASNNASASGTSSKASSVKEKLGPKPNGTAAAKVPPSSKSTEVKPTSKTASIRPSPTSAKPTTSTKSSGGGTTPKSPSTRQSRTSLESTKSAASSRSSTVTKPTAASAAKKADTAQTTGEQAKSKPRSPTRPLKLPSHLTAPTASSAAKHGEAPSTTTSTTRKPASRPTAAAAKQASTRRDGPRQSLPAASTAKPPESRTNTRAPDDSFLARMMRPTASSANKTAEKTEVKSSPPKRASSIRTKPSAQSLVGKTKKVVATTLKGKEPEQNGTLAQGDGQHEAENSIVTEDSAAETPTLEAPEEQSETPEASKLEIPAEPTLQNTQEPADDPVPEVEPTSERAQTPSKGAAVESLEEAPLEAAKASAPEPTAEPPNEPAVEILPETSTSVAQEAEKGLKTPENELETSKKDEPLVESTPEQTRIADNTLEQTPAFDGATIR